MKLPFALIAAVLLAADFLVSPAGAAEPIPDKLVVLTFDDSSASHHAIAAPLLKRFGFGATFFITEGFTFRTNKRDYMTWEQIAELHRDGFEIGNHTRDHLGITEKTVPRLAGQLEAIAARCREHGIPAPVSFAWPGNRFHASALPVLQQAGIRFARRGGEPEVPYALGGGVAYQPGADHPLLVPTTGDARPDWTLENLKRALALGGRGRIPVLQFHGVPDGEHPWVNTPRERFEEYMAWLHREGFKVIALRDLARYTEGKPIPGDPLAVMEARRRAAAAAPVFSSDKELIDVRDSAKVRARRPLLIAHRGGVLSGRIPEG
jgi:peptidoglycan/xylan/chitin deacetylase (PgdA/CDA1 family)